MQGDKNRQRRPDDGGDSVDGKTPIDPLAYKRRRAGKRHAHKETRRGNKQTANGHAHTPGQPAAQGDQVRKEQQVCHCPRGDKEEGQALSAAVRIKAPRARTHQEHE